MDMNVDVDPDWGASTAASDRGAGPLGFSGTVSKSSETGDRIGYAFR